MTISVLSLVFILFDLYRFVVFLPRRGTQYGFSGFDKSRGICLDEIEP